MATQGKKRMPMNLVANDWEISTRSSYQQPLERLKRLRSSLRHRHSSESPSSPESVSNMGISLKRLLQSFISVNT